MKRATLILAFALLFVSYVQTETFEGHNTGRQLKDGKGRDGKNPFGGGNGRAREHPSGGGSDHSKGGEGDDGDGGGCPSGCDLYGSSSSYSYSYSSSSPSPSPSSKEKPPASPSPSVIPDFPASPSPSKSPDMSVSPSPSETPVSPSPSPSEMPDFPVSPSPSESPDVPDSPSPSPSESPDVPDSPSPSPSFPFSPFPSPDIPFSPFPSPDVPDSPSPSPDFPISPFPSPDDPASPSPSPDVPVSPSPDVIDEGDPPVIVIVDTGGEPDEPAEPAETTTVVLVETVPVEPEPVEPEPVPTEPSPADPPFPIDFSTVESALRTFIFLGDVEGAAGVLGSPRVISLGAGLTYPTELTPLVDQSTNRNEDPDVVAFKALAKSALDTSEATKLATAVVLSFQPDCQCAALSADEADDIRIAFAQDFTNRTELAEILAADANEELVPPGRRLTQAGKSPVTSFVCAFCWPTKQCRKVRWC